MYIVRLAKVIRFSIWLSTFRELPSIFETTQHFSESIVCVLCPFFGNFNIKLHFKSVIISCNNSSFNNNHKTCAQKAERQKVLDILIVLKSNFLFPILFFSLFAGKRIVFHLIAVRPFGRCDIFSSIFFLTRCASSKGGNERVCIIFNHHPRLDFMFETNVL